MGVGLLVISLILIIISISADVKRTTQEATKTGTICAAIAVPLFTPGLALTIAGPMLWKRSDRLYRRIMRGEFGPLDGPSGQHGGVPPSAGNDASAVPPASNGPTADHRRGGGWRPR